MSGERVLKMSLASCMVLSVVAIGLSLHAYTSPKQPVAVLDLQQVAATLGKDKQIAAAVESRTAQLNTELVAVRQKLEAALATAEDAAKADPENEESIRLAAMARQTAQQRMANANQQASQNLQAFRVALAEDFYKQSKALAGQVAREQGIAVVVARNEAFLLDYQQAVDITDEVVRRGLVQQTSAQTPVEQ